MRQNITLLGSTGSIGQATLDVIARHPDRYRLFALTAHTQIDTLAAQCVRHRPQYAVVGSTEGATRLETYLRAQKIKTEVSYGTTALVNAASSRECNTVMAAIVGAAGLLPTLAAARAGKKILLANKEALVMSGALFMEAIATYHARLLPIDSEHNAVFQCLPSACQTSIETDRLKQAGVEKILLTASGGPFLHRDVASLAHVTPEEAIVHPKWTMGRKISVDSATMMNKGLEIIEAHWLFGAHADQIDVVIHPQSLIHSMVSYKDGSMMMQCGHPDMRIAIAHALAYPERMLSGVAPLDITTMGQWQFLAPDVRRFPCLSLAYHALKSGGSAPAILNAANEVAVEAFLSGRIGFQHIEHIVAKTLEKYPGQPINTIEELLEEDRHVRLMAQAFI